MKKRKLDGPLLPLVQRLNEIRRAEPALQRLDNLRWLETESEQLVAYAKDDVVCVVNIDPFAAHEGVCIVPSRSGCRRRSRRATCSRGERRSRGARAATTSARPRQGHVLEGAP